MREQLVELAFEVLQLENQELEFKELWNRVVSKTNLGDEAVEFISDFYSDISLDNRFIGIDKTKWDLRVRRKVSETIIDTGELTDDEEDAKFELEE